MRRLAKATKDSLFILIFFFYSSPFIRRYIMKKEFNKCEMNELRYSGITVANTSGDWHIKTKLGKSSRKVGTREKFRSKWEKRKKKNFHVECVQLILFSSPFIRVVLVWHWVNTRGTIRRTKKKNMQQDEKANTKRPKLKKSWICSTRKPVRASEYGLRNLVRAGACLAK